MCDTRQLFSEHGLRCTKQRTALYDALAECTSHPTADELYRMVKPHVGHVSLATVYNTLEAFCRAGLCRKLATDFGTCRYDADTSEHVHVRMRETGQIADVPEELGARLMDNLPVSVLQEIESHLGIEIDGLSIQLLAKTPVGANGANGVKGTRVYGINGVSTVARF